MIYKLGLTAESKVNIRNTSIIVNGAVVVEGGKKSENEKRPLPFSGITVN
jgi:hypothetical protein